MNDSQTFSQEVHEQEPKMETVVQAGRSGLLEVQWPLRTPGGRGLDRWVGLRTTCYSLSPSSLVSLPAIA